MSSFAIVSGRRVMVNPIGRVYPRVLHVPPVRRLAEGLARSTRTSEYLTRIHNFEQSRTDIENLCFISADWNAYGSPEPSSKAISVAQEALNMLRYYHLIPTKILPSAEGGVAMTFHSRTRNRAVLETLNNGESFIILYDLDGNNETLDWNTSMMEQGFQLEKLEKYLRG